MFTDVQKVFEVPIILFYSIGSSLVKLLKPSSLFVRDIMQMCDMTLFMQGKHRVGNQQLFQEEIYEDAGEKC